MHTPPSVRRIVRHGVAAVTVSVFAAGLLVGVTASATAKPKPTLSQVEAKLKKLQSQLEKLDQQYDQVKQQLSGTNQRLVLVNKELAAYGVRFAAMRQQIGRIAVTAYEDGNINSSITLLTSGKPQQILDQSSILLELSASNEKRRSTSSWRPPSSSPPRSNSPSAPGPGSSSSRPGSASASRR